MLDALCSRLPTAEQCGFEMQLPDDMTTADALRMIAGTISGILSQPGRRRHARDQVRGGHRSRAGPSDRRPVPGAAPRRPCSSLLRRGVERGEVRPDAATPLVADVLPSILTYRIDHAARAGDRARPARRSWTRSCSRSSSRGDGGATLGPAAARLVGFCPLVDPLGSDRRRLRLVWSMAPHC